MILMAPTLRCGASAMSPRAKLRRAWIALRVACGWFGLSMLISAWVVRTWTGEFGPTGLVILLFCMGMRPKVRARVTRYFGSIGTHDFTEQQQAAAIAALIGSEKDAAHALQTAKARFRTLPLHLLTEADLASKTPDPSLYAKTQPAEFGKCDAFASHSWSDDGVRKFATLHEWAAGKGGHAKVSIWLDKACINQQNINESLACLPVFLSGCQELLVLAGETYTSRLWCCMELFTFVHMGGSHDRIHLWQIGGDEVGAALMAFDANRAQCFLRRDREKLLGVIETAFGDLAQFNVVVASVFADKVMVGVTPGRDA